jgi:hypothetical protein
LSSLAGRDPALRVEIEEDYVFLSDSQSRKATASALLRSNTDEGA